MRRVVFVLLFCAGLAALAAAQAPQPQVHANLNQLMQALLFPNSNVIFAAQAVDPATIAQAADPTIAADPLRGVYNGWLAIENAGLALSEAANLLTISGRVCANGRPVPTANADWPAFVQGLRAAGMAAYKAGQARSTDAVLDAADVMTTACSNCHDRYREVPIADRCM
jgi:hypothetical protein